MAAWEIFAMFAGIALVVAGVGVALYLIGKVQKPTEIQHSQEPLRWEYKRTEYNRPAPALWRETRMVPLTQAERDALSRLQEKSDRAEKATNHVPKGQIKTDPPRSEHTSSPKEAL